MAVIAWDSVGKRTAVYGLDRGVLYPQNAPGVQWSGLVSVNEDENVASDSYYFDGFKYFDDVRLGDFQADVEAFTYPDALELYIANGLKTFGPKDGFDFCYRTSKASDLSLTSGYELHLVYNCIVVPKSRSYASTTDGTDTSPFQWTLLSAAEPVPNAYPTAHIVVDSTLIPASAMALLEDQLYGTPNFAPFMPRPDSVIEICKSTGFAVVDHGDGTWSVFGPDSAVSMLDANTFQINWPSLSYLDANTYTVSST